ncbi:MAG: tetratricopeptide repeat protein [Bacteroidetes bacterium]|nr:tetratricopeptide repeat protein [Bacteroidota bacterium]MBU1423972.1 tetratricopeptide repeat protein [Bacteroidota bacterium]MBU2635654.1 tetratricopeptide repeat protein [Bacteroidota bacterium]
MKFLKYVLMLLIVSELFADEVRHQFEQANQFYRTGDYKNAVALYEAIIKNGYETPELFFNLANAYFKVDNLPASILYYERAKKLLPNDDDINYNLKIANLKVVDKIEPVPRLFFIEWWISMRNLFSADTWTIFGIAGFWLSAFTWALFRIARKSIIRRLFFFTSSIIVFITIFCLFFGYQQYQTETSQNSAIVFFPSVSIKSSPDERGTDLFILHEGVKIEILDAVGDWKKFKLADGKIGWLPDTAIEII